MQSHTQAWYFEDENGTFKLKAPHKYNYLYFPLVSEKGLISAITPTLHGDIKIDQNTFLTPPVSVEDLHTSRAARNFWVNIEGFGAWSATGNSAAQLAHRFLATDAEPVELEAGFLWHKVTRAHSALGLRAETTNVVPPDSDTVELMRVTLTNTGQAALTLIPTAAIPIYGRSADNLRDHRHVTSLLHRIRTQPAGVLVCPTLSFDERGHQPNTITYAVLGVEGDGTLPISFFPVVEDFIGEGGTYDWPEAVVDVQQQGNGAGAVFEGYEALGGLRFQTVTLVPGQQCTFILILAVLQSGETAEHLMERYGTHAKFDSWLSKTQRYWDQKLGAFKVMTGDARFDRWMKWVALQPILRRLCGNSFLPYHDYGRGGRGWRDLWQDLLALLLMEPANVRALLLSNFAGVRMDGSNATIIGTAPGEFKADRNNIPRVWMDHGAWPLLTTQLYLDHTGDLGFLLQEQVYFKDQFTHRAQSIDAAWQPAHGTQLKTADGEVYRGTVFEHLLVQHLTAFYNVGEHNILKLEGADWNDGLDMARRRGESVAFTALYTGNLRTLGRLALDLSRLGVTEIALAAELTLLLDTLDAPVEYGSVAAKQARLDQYFAAGQHTVSGNKVKVALQPLADDLNAKANWLQSHLQRQEWVTDQAGHGWFNGYYDDDGARVEGEHPWGVRMTLTGQVFALMGGIATAEQAAEIVRAADHYLYDSAVGGYRLNTHFGEVMLNLGRCFGFAFGHKENGAMFSHMAVMYANALYQRNLVQAGHRVLAGLYQHSQEFAVSYMYPGLPEYVSARGRGMYPFLTGSASWYLLTLVTEVFGVKGHLGDLVLSPKLVQSQFGESGKASLLTLFAGKQLNVTYHNPERLDYGKYEVQTIRLNGDPVKFEWGANQVRLSQETWAALADDQIHQLDVDLRLKA